MARLDGRLRGVLARLEQEAATWREEPLKRVAVANAALHPLRRRQFAAFGAHSIVHRPRWLYGTRHAAVGEAVIVMHGAWLSVERPAWEKPEPALVIGDGVAMRFGCTLSAAESLVIEPHVGMGASVTITDSRHTWHEAHPNPLWGPIETAPVRVGTGTWLADRVSITAGADVGERCAIGPNTVVSGTVPDHSIVLGNPGRVVGKTR